MTDEAGNSETYTFTIDKTKPIGIINNLSNSTLNLSNDYVTFTWNELGCTATLDGSKIVNGFIISSEGLHEIILTDKAGNTSTYEFTIDKTAPVGTLEGVENNGTTNDNVTFTWDELGCTATLNGSKIVNGFIISEEGLHEIILTDKAGNTSTYTFMINTTPPKYNIYCNNEIINGSATKFNSYVYFTWNDLECSATLNGEEYIKNQIISEEKDYLFKIIDKYGNTATYEFEIDKTPFTKNYEYFISDIKYYNTVNNWWKSYTYLFNTQKNQYDINNYYSFTSYEDAYSFALHRETEICETGIYTKGQQIWSNIYNCYVSIYDPENAIDGCSYTIYKSKSSTNLYLAYFSGLYLADSMEQYASQSIKEQSIPSTISPAYPGDSNIDGQDIFLSQNDFSIIYTKTDVIFNYKENNSILKINGVNMPYTTKLSLEGTYVITEIDEAQNEFQYIILIDKTAPEFIVSNIENAPLLQNSLNQNTSIKVSNSLSISLNDNFDLSCILKITLPTGEEIYKYNCESYNLTMSGQYTISTIDTARNISDVKTIYLSFESPTITVVDTLDSDQKPIGFTFSINLINKLNHISSLTIQKWDETNNLWDRIYLDANDLTIDNKSTVYYFTSSGKYQFILIDDFGREIINSYELNRDKPTGYLHDSSGSIINSGFVQLNEDGTINTINPAITKSSIYIDWNDTAANKINASIIYQNGVTNIPYYNGNIIREAGTYIIRLIDNDSNYCDFAFTIDKTAPVGTLFTEDNLEIVNGKSNKNVYFTWDEDGCTASYTTNSSSNIINYYKNSVLSEAQTYNFILRDKAGNISTYTCTIDKTAPVVRIYSGSYEIPNNTFTNKNIKFIWNENGCTATLNGEEYISGSIKSENMKYILKITDSFGNVTAYTVTLNNTPVTATYYNLNNNPINEKSLYNEHIYILPSKDECIIQLNGVNYLGEPITIDNLYTLKIIDKYGNIYNNSFTIDTTAPTGILTGVENEGITNNNVSFTWSDLYCTATLNGNVYTKGTTISSEGFHEIILTDKAGNPSTYTFTIDKTKPVGTLEGVENGGYTNNNVYFTWDEDGCTATIDGYIYNGYDISSEGLHEIVLTDEAGNTSTYTFTIDKTAPVGILTGVENGGITNKNVILTWNELGCTATLDGNVYTKGASITKVGPHEIILTDEAGNTSAYTFTIDKTAPVGILTGVENEGYTNNNVYFTWDELGCTATLNEKVYLLGTTISSEGFHEIILTDEAGNTETYTFTIDKTAPVGTLEGVENEGITNKNVILTWNELGYTATIDTKEYEKNQIISSEGFHEIILTDKAGNTSTYTFTIDKTAPVGILTGVENGGITNNSVILNIINNYNYVVLTKSSTGENHQLYNSYYEFEEESTYDIYIYDLANNETYLFFTIDTTAPTGILTGVENEGITNNNVSFTWSDLYCTATLNGNVYTKGTTISSEGFHEIILTDKAGNPSTYTFTIDKTKPVGTLEGVENEGITKDNVKLTWDDDTITATLNQTIYYSNMPISSEGFHEIILTDKAGNTSTYTFTIDKTAPSANFENNLLTNKSQQIKSMDTSKTAITYSINNSSFKSLMEGSTISAEGKYIILITDEAGNTSTYTFTIDKTAPVGTLEGVENEGITKDNVTFTWTERYCSATLNNKVYLMGTIISEEGLHEIILTDKAGNTSTYTFTIDKTKPVGILTGVENEGITIYNVTFTWTERYCSATLDNKSYTKGTTITKEGLHDIILTDKAGNTSTYTFTIDKTAPVGILTGVENEGYTNNNVYFTWDDKNITASLNNEFYENGKLITTEGKYTIILVGQNGLEIKYTFTIDKTAPVGTLEGVENKSTTKDNVYFTWDELGYTATLNGEEYEKNQTISEEGLHEIILRDEAGNTAAYTFTIDKTAPTIFYNGKEFNELINSSIIFTWIEDNCSAKLNNVIYEKNEEITEEGEYIFTLEDFFGNVATYEFTIDTTAPTGILTGVENNGTTNDNVTFTWDELGCSATLNGEEYEKNQIISSEGLHEIILTDKAGNTETYTFTIDRVYPSASIYNTHDTLIDLELNSYINYNIYFNFEDTYQANYTVNNQQRKYESGFLLTEEGEYNLLIINPKNNLIKEYTFTIDKTAPVGTLEGVENEGKTNKSVTITWNKKEAKIRVNNEYQSNTGTLTISSNGIWNVEIYDEAGNTSTYHFERYKKTISNDELNSYIKINDENNKTQEEPVNLKSIYTSNVLFDISDQYQVTLTYLKDGIETSIEYENRTLLTEDNSYKITLTDEFGNENTFSFKIILAKNDVPEYLGKNIAILIIILSPCILITTLFLIKLKTKHSNPFQKKSKA